MTTELIPTIHHCGKPVIKVKMADTTGCPIHMASGQLYERNHEALSCRCRPVSILNCQSCNWSRRA